MRIDRTADHAARPSLRRQLAWMFTTLALVVAIAQAALVYLTGERAEEALIDSVASEQLRLSIAQYRRDPMLAQPNTADMRLYVDDPERPAALPDYLQDLPRKSGEYELFPHPGIEYHVAVAEQDRRWFYLVYDVADHERRQQNVLAVLAISVVVIALVVLLASDLIARRLTGDLERLSLAVHDDDSSSAPRELRPLARHAESAELARALDERRLRLEAALARERAFSAAASHELRTPLMQAASTLELLGTEDLSPSQRRRVEQLRASLTEITMLTAGLLRVARGTSAASGSSVDLAALVEEVFEHLRRDADARSIELQSRVPVDAVAVADRDALWIVLVNVVRNAIRHSGGSTLQLGWDGAALCVRDDGRGFDATQPQRRQPTSDAARVDDDGLGLGLSIVERICEGAGWSLAIESSRGSGTQVAIGLGRLPVCAGPA